MNSRQNDSNGIIYKDSPEIPNNQLNALFSAAWDNHQPKNFQPILEKSLAYICAYNSEELIGFVNLAWDGGIHGFILDTTVHPGFQRKGIGTEMLKQICKIAKENSIEWIHVDFAPHLQGFYDNCGFTSTCAGLIKIPPTDKMKNS